MHTPTAYINKSRYVHPVRGPAFTNDLLSFLKPDLAALEHDFPHPRAAADARGGRVGCKRV
jgi:hypothetical protein